MPDVAEALGGPPAVDQTGNLVIWWVPTIASLSLIPTVAEIAAGKRLTYSFRTGGWGPTSAQERVTDPRLTSPQTKESFGPTTPTIPDLDYVESTAASSAAVILAAGGPGFLVDRRGLPQTDLIASGQKVRVWDVALGAQAPTPVDGSGKFYITQPVAVRGYSGLVAVTA